MWGDLGFWFGGGLVGGGWGWGGGFVKSRVGQTFFEETNDSGQGTTHTGNHRPCSGGEDWNMGEH